MRKAWMLPLVAIVMTAACKDDPLTPQSASLRRQSNLDNGAASVSVMSRNIFVGFDGDAAIAALATGDPNVFLPVLQQAVGQLQRTNFPLRAAAFADEIAAQRPHAVGVQEAYHIMADLSGLGIPLVIDEDHLAMLQAAIAARHLPYRLVDTVMDTDMRPFPGISIVDREALFVDTTRVVVGAVLAKQFETNIGVIAPGIDKRTGFIAAAVTIGGRSLTIVTTHLESDLGPESYPVVSQVRAAQAMEIGLVVGDSAAIVVGDLNDNAGSLMYQVFAGAGFTDLWTALRPGVAGNTDSCFQADLSDALASCRKRIDFVFARGLVHPQAGVLGRMQLVGITPNERMTTPAGWLWPSDHAGLVGEVLLPPALGLAAAN